MSSLKKFWWLIVIGLILRLVLASISFHPDVKIINYTSKEILKKGNFDLYNFLNSTDSPEVADDLPLQYWIRIPVEFITRPLINLQVEEKFLNNTSLLFGHSELFTHLLIIKLPLILFDILLGALLIFVVSENYRKTILALWMFNPVTLWATSMIGQVDIMPTFFLVLAYFFLKGGNKGMSAIFLGVAAALKSFPFILAPFLIMQGKNLSEKVKLTILLGLPWVLTVLPYIFSPHFRSQALFAPQMDKILYAKIALSGGEGIYITLGLLFILYFIFAFQKRSADDFLHFSLASLLLVLAFTHFHIQWFLWVTPFLLIWLLNNWKSNVYISFFGLIFGLILMLFLFESSLQIKLFSPLIPSLDKGLGLADILSDERRNILKNIAATIFAASSIFLSWRIIGSTISKKIHDF